MKMETIAEWVEDKATLNALKTLGVDYVQGYAVDKPQPLFK
jgi:EAL domain-containing protein (putative c-di-GMP-specific phosphodiesterase class I)